MGLLEFDDIDGRDSDECQRNEAYYLQGEAEDGLRNSPVSGQPWNGAWPRFLDRRKPLPTRRPPRIPPSRAAPGAGDADNAA